MAGAIDGLRVGVFGQVSCGIGSSVCLLGGFGRGKFFSKVVKQVVAASLYRLRHSA